MKKICIVLTVLMAMLGLGSCEKVIDVKLNDAERKIVVEGFLSNLNSGAEVRVSTTKSFNENNSFNGVSGAVVSLSSSTGGQWSFTEQQPGIYKTAAFAGVPGVSYTLTVTAQGKTFTATSVMPQPVLLDSIYTTNFGLAGNESIVMTPEFNDPPGLGNSYRFVNVVNGIKEGNVYVQNDALSDGRTMTRPLANNDSDIKTGDVVAVEMQCIDEAVYKYWYSLSQLEAGAGQSAAPANPVSNFSGGCLGYFSAHTVSSKTIIVQ